MGRPIKDLVGNIPPIRNLWFTGATKVTIGRRKRTYVHVEYDCYETNWAGEHAVLNKWIPLEYLDETGLASFHDALIKRIQN